MPLSMVQFSPYLNGSFVHLERAERVFAVPNPCRPDEIVASAAWSKGCVDEIVEGMVGAQTLFSGAPLEKRLEHVAVWISILRREKENFCAALRKELARSQVAVEEEWRSCEMLFDHLTPFCSEALSQKNLDSTFSWRYESVGLCLLSANVSLPLYSLLAAVLPALVAGNAVCVRPSLHCLLSAQLLATTVHEAKFPAGLFQCVFGDLEVYRRILLTRQFDCVLYSGGDESLEQIRRDLSTSQKTRLVLCSGGKNAALVMKDANLELAVQNIIYGATVDCGQRLESTGLVLVDKNVSEKFLEMLVKGIKNLPIGVKNDLGSANTHVMGPLCSANSYERFLRFQGIAHRESQETLRWGKPIDNPGNGYFVSPGVHLVALEKLSSSVYASNAFFGPDLGVSVVEDAAQAVQVLDKMQVARVLSVFSEDVKNREPIRMNCHIPTLQWNAPTTRMDPRLPSVGRGRAGNSYVTGLRFLFNTVYPKSVHLILAAFAFLGVFLSPSEVRADYRKAVEGNEVVKGKFYPRSGRFELGVGGGGILNQSFLDTYLMNGYLRYNINDWHAVSLEGFYGISTDKNERKCVESFYRDSQRAEAYGGGSSCNFEDKNNANTARDPGIDKAVYPNDAGQDPKTNGRAKDLQDNLPLERKPAYMPIRKIDSMAMVNYQWTPVYGKALWFMSAVGYLDLFASAGLGVAMSTYWEKKTTIGTGSTPVTEGTSNPAEFGDEGRPAPVSQTSPAFGLGVGSRFLFLKHVTAELNFRNFSVIAPTGDSSFMNFYALWGGIGVIF
jgi:acyl-CoA reductase-like NAD-dependent aldehyde dehydrogenase